MRTMSPETLGWSPESQRITVSATRPTMLPSGALTGRLMRPEALTRVRTKAWRAGSRLARSLETSLRGLSRLLRACVWLAIRSSSDSSRFRRGLKLRVVVRLGIAHLNFTFLTGF